MTITTLVIIPFVYYKMIKHKKKLETLKQGRDGEKAVGNTLNYLEKQALKFFMIFKVTTLTLIMS
ncbi:MAG: hypothetical protein ISR69_02095 [Gammaproteobacteria bacterium]|nr:hypothetical protein [Gammaproteobacteria bacterium]